MLNRMGCAGYENVVPGTSELIESLVLATDAYAESIANDSVLSQPLATNPATGIQYFVYHADNLPSVLSGKVAVGSITPGNVVTVDKSSVTTDCQDSHNFFDVIFDGDSDLLVAGDMHGVDMNAARLTGGSIHFTAWAAAPSEAGATDEASVTYPKTIRLANGDCLRFFRDGGSGQANLILKKWTASTNTWRCVGGLGTIIVNGEAAESFYPDVPYWDEARGRLHVMGCWRISTSLATNHDRLHFYLETSDGWQTCTAKTADGTAQTLPVTRANAAYAEVGGRFATNSGLTNVGAVTIDSNGNPRGFTFTDPGDGIAQLVAHRWNGSAWVRCWIPDDVQLQSGAPFSYVGVTGGAYRTISSPHAVCDGVTDRTIILMRSDTQGAGVWALICERADLTQWVWKQLTADDLGNAWFGQRDEYQWRVNGRLDMLVQKAQLKDYGTEPDIGPQTLKRVRFRPKSAAYTYTAPTALWDPNSYSGCFAYLAPRVGGVKATGGGALADVNRLKEVMDARSSSALFVQGTTSDAPELIWNQFGARRGGILFVAANLDFMTSTDAAMLAAVNGVNQPFICSVIWRTTTVSASGHRIWGAGTDNSNYLSIGSNTSKKLVIERDVAGTVKQCVGNTTLADNTTYHITYGFDGTNGFIYLNNVRDDAAGQSLSFAGSAAYANLLLGGRIRAGRELYLSGYLGTMRFGNSIPSVATFQAGNTAQAAEYGLTI